VTSIIKQEFGFCGNRLEYYIVGKSIRTLSNSSGKIVMTFAKWRRRPFCLTEANRRSGWIVEKTALMVSKITTTVGSGRFPV
jgi:hypothetical protein